MQTHQMEIERTYPSGVEEWWCPTCGRRFVAQWAPETRRLILDPGDAHIPHRGGDLSIHLGVEPASDDHTPPLTDAEANSPWAEWLDDLDLDSPDTAAPPSNDD